MFLSKTDMFGKRRAAFQKKKNACGKPVQPQTGLGGTNSYKNVIYIDSYLLWYPIAIINNINYIMGPGPAHGMGTGNE